MNNLTCNTDRRLFIKRMGLIFAPMALILPWQKLFASISVRSLSFYHTHTSEQLDIVYYENGHYLTEELQLINKFLRDFRTEDIFPIEPQLMDILYSLKIVNDSYGTYEVISGYRSPKTNNELRLQGKGIAKKSLHMFGKAIDVRLTDVKTINLKKTAIAMKSGGVGYYPKSDFVHLDTGRARTW